MSEENIELMRAAIEALKARDGESLDELFDDDVEWRPVLTAGGGVEGTVYRGRSGMKKYLEEVDSGFDEMIFEISDFEPIGPDRVLYRGRALARGSASGIQLDVQLWGLWEIRDGKLVRGAGFLSEAEALRGAGSHG